ncbi:MAG: helix-turn-helix domain-containing protein [Simkaniaceae bacterium]|nr:helix-turn-helix domain-containing protein [Simkaniaceae bacterium]
MEDDVKRIGDRLKLAREELNISLKEVENSTSIRLSYLEAIEKGSSDKFLTNVYMFGFMRQYASFLGLDLDQLSKEFPVFFKAPSVKHEFEYGIGTLEVRGSTTGGVRWFPNLLWAGASALILILAYYFMKYVGLV